MESVRNMDRKFHKLPLPPWAAGIFTALWCELLLHLWTAETLSPSRLMTIGLFALGLGCILALGLGCILAQGLSFLGKKTWCKWVCTGLLAVLAVFYLVNFFVWQFFQTFMSPITILKGAGGVATGFLGDAVSLCLKGWWRILLMLLPAIVYPLICQPTDASWKARYFLLAGVLLGYGLGFGLVSRRPADAARLQETYQYESAVNAFGLHLATVLDLSGAGKALPPGRTFCWRLHCRCRPSPPILPCRKGPRRRSRRWSTSPM